VQPVEAPPGQSYIAVARVPVSPTKPTEPATSTKPAIGGVPVSELAPYLQLPTEPAPVVALAHQIVAGAKSQAAEAADLARWFNSGRYRYTLTPPPGGPDALESFLFTTREGFCQQFAAAYGVLARIDGLPTRVAVGFTTGDSEGHGRYQVTGADAHVWPEVYLGPSTGWTSYEPTPASSGEATGVGVNSGSRSTSQNSGSRSTATTASTVANIRRPSSTNATVPSTLALPGRGKAATSVTPGGTPVNGLVVVGIGAALVVLALVGLGLRRAVRAGWDPVGLLRERRRRRRRRPAPDPRAEVLVQWRDAMDVLERARLGRRPAETLEEHSTRLRSLVGAQWLAPHRPVTDDLPGLGVTIEDSVDAYTRLAEMAARASYGADPCSPQEAAEAGQFGAVVRSGLARQGGRRGPLVSS